MVEFGKLDRLVGWHLFIATETERKVFFDNCPDGVPEHWCAVRSETRCYDREVADLVVEWQRQPGRVISISRGSSKPTTFRQYALLPRTEPRLVIPLGDNDQLQRGLKLHQPGRLTIKIATSVVSRLAGIGLTWPLKQRLLQIDTTLPSEPEIDASAVLYLGTDDNCRKTTILPPQQHRIQKHGGNSLAAEAIRHEAKTLAALGETGVASMVPRLVSLKEVSGGALLEQEYRARTSGFTRNSTSQVVQFLKVLSQVGYEIRDGIPGHRSHGDFAPWNLHLTSNGIFVFDWEKSQEWAPALTDAFHFSIAPFVYVRNRRDARAAMDEALAFGRKVALASGVDTALLSELWKLWLRSKPFDQQNEKFRTLLVQASL